MMESLHLNKKHKVTESSRAPYLWSSPSSSSSSIGNNYHVFLSFCGADTRGGFADHLYQRFVNVGVALLCVFRDEKSLTIGEQIGRELLDAIPRSKISIPILSENYASSEWCLMELAEMMECKESLGHIVLPIFYKVTPAEVRHQKGKFGEAFCLLQKKFDGEPLEKWKKVLVDVCSLKGWESEKFADKAMAKNQRIHALMFLDRHEGKLVEAVVETTLIELSKEFRLKVPEHLAGTECHVRRIIRMLDPSLKNTQVIGLYGMSGIGKMTLAKIVYNELFTKFRHRSFIANIQGSIEDKAKSIENLQSQLIYNLLDIKVKVNHVDEGCNILQLGLENKDVLILLDNVSDEDQLVTLFGKYDHYSLGIRIIITTQNQDLLKRDNFVSYEVTVLTDDQALFLFSRYAFRHVCPPCNFDKVSRQVVATTGGLPLALEVIGSFLNGKNDLDLWEETLKKLRNIPHGKVKQRLKLSYETLDHRTQQVFLDIACFFNGINKRIPMYMWDSCKLYPNEAIDTLLQRSLIKIGDHREILMHDQLRALGREIVLEEDFDEPKNRSRLWDYEEALEVLEGQESIRLCACQSIESGIARALAIHLDGKRCPQATTHVNKEHFGNVPKLRFLDVSHVNFAGDFRNSLSELRWFRWESEQLSLEAMNFCMKKLFILDLAGSIILEDWRGWCSIVMAEKLKVISLTNCSSLESIPDLLPFKSLEILRIQKCSNLMRIGSSIGGLKTLICLDLRLCNNLKELPQEVGDLEKLKELFIDYTAIEEFPLDIFLRLKNLELLSATYWFLSKDLSVLSESNHKVLSESDHKSMLYLLLYWNNHWKYFSDFWKPLSDLRELELLSATDWFLSRDLFVFSELDHKSMLYLLLYWNLHWKCFSDLSKPLLDLRELISGFKQILLSESNLLKPLLDSRELISSFRQLLLSELEPLSDSFKEALMSDLSLLSQICYCCLKPLSDSFKEALKSDLSNSPHMRFVEALIRFDRAHFRF